MTDEQAEPKLQVDTDWKAQAQAEKERLTEKEKEQVASADEAGSGRPELPPPDFRGLMGILASQALMGLGTMQDPGGKGVVVDLEGSHFAIELLSVLEEKTKGNLSDDEDRELKQLVSELRARFVQITQLIAQQAAGGMGTDPTAPDLMGGDMPPPIA